LLSTYVMSVTFSNSFESRGLKIANRGCFEAFSWRGWHRQDQSS
jgi:hypothetical protein